LPVVYSIIIEVFVYSSINIALPLVGATFHFTYWNLHLCEIITLCCGKNVIQLLLMPGFWAL